MSFEARARTALGRHDYQAAAEAAQVLTRQAPESPTGWFLLGMIEAAAGRVARALPLVEAAVARGPQAEHLAQYARLLILLRRDGDAADAARRAMALEPSDALSLDTIGCVEARLGNHAASLAPFTAAVALEPNNLDFRYNLAAASGFTGRIADARAHYEAILARDPGNARTHYALSILSKQTPADNHVSRLETALAAAAEPGDRLRLHYALAKEQEDIGNAAAAFDHLATANGARKAELGYNFSTDAAIFDAIEAAFADPAAAPGPGLDGPAPIFVIGMPRTGTTLVDRILSSHPAMVSAGELQAMPLAVKQLADTRSRLIIDPETVAAGQLLDPHAIGAAYMARAAHHVPPGTTRFVDKLPANFLYAGHIARALPQATIVCLRRHPMDTVWSNFKNLFASTSAYYFYANELMDTARYYARFDALMALWRRQFPGRILELDYEALVADQEAQTRRLLAHCRLDWSDACLSFHENTAAVATPSAAQVRRPMNADAVARWKTHAQALEPVRAWFDAHGIRTD
ncbi:sulfotransferase [Sphingomonas sp. PB4P5]|uniref:sulfotransferase family protein n=1 Tax=Parasphingomonas puruogangriensis TaxID=3096155 RepID=UPI003FA757B6